MNMIIEQQGQAYYVKCGDMCSRTYGILFLVMTCIGLCITSASADNATANNEQGSLEVADGSSLFTITATGGEFGTISPSGDVTVMEGDNVTFLMTPDPANLNCWGAGTRYVVWNLTVDGTPVDIGPEPSIQPVEYTFSAVESNHTIHATFSNMFITARPFARFTTDVRSGPVPLAVNFTQVLVSPHTRILWSFGDNSTSSEENATHIYTCDGRYTVSLTIWCDEDEYYTEEMPDYITAGSAPVADFTMNTSQGTLPLTVQFFDNSTGTLPLAYCWTFGDNTTSAEQNPVHTFSQPRIYEVNLTVANNWGSSTKSGVPVIVYMRPIGGDKGYFLVHCTVDGAAVFFDQTYKGMIQNGSLVVPVYITAAPYHTYMVDKEGYQPFSAEIPRYPPRDGTVDLWATLVPANGTISGWVASGSDYGQFMVPGARVRISPALPFRTLPFFREATTDARGLYRLSGLPTGIPLYANVLSPVNVPEGYYERPVLYQVGAGGMITCADSTVYPVIPALSAAGSTQVNFITRQNPAGLQGSMIFF